MCLLQEKYCNDWSHSVLSKPKLRTYVIFKDIYQPEPYVMSFMNRKRRSILAQLRCGILPLQLEVGRWHNKDECDRLCLLCDDGEVENEKHFLLQCKYFNDERAILYQCMIDRVPNFVSLSDNDKLKLFMSKDHVQVFSKYLYTIYERRQNKIFI